LNQEKSSECQRLLSLGEKHILHMSDYSVHSIGTLLFRQQKSNVFLEFIDDVFLKIGMPILTLGVHDMQRIVETAGTFNLDFDDAYQYVIAKKYSLVIVSYDRDFERTDQKRKLPEELLT
jgi:predicted nucleic acid-binding protein